MRHAMKPGEPGTFLPGEHGTPWEPPRPRLPVLTDGLTDERQVPEKRKVLITGGSSGIGAATAEEFAARGFLVAVTGRDSRALDHVARVTGGVRSPGTCGNPAAPAASSTRPPRRSTALTWWCPTPASAGPGRSRR